MANPCYEAQVARKLKVEPEIAKAFMDAASALRKQGLGYDDIVRSLANQTGRDTATILHILESPRIKVPTEQSRIAALAKARAEAGRTRRMQNAAQRSLDAMVNGGPSGAAKAWNFLRNRSLAGHSVVSQGTHLMNMLYAGGAEAKLFGQALKDNFKNYVGKKGLDRYNSDWQRLRLHPKYEPALKSGLDIGEDISPADLNTYDSFKKAQKINVPYSKRAFGLTLKKARFQAWLNGLDKMSDNSPEAMQQWSTEVNYATGSVNRSLGDALPIDRAIGTASQATGNQMLASKLFYAKRMQALMTPLKWLGLGGRMNPAQRAAVNQAMSLWGRIATVNAGTLALNYGINYAFGFQLPNLTNPGQSDFLRYRMGNLVLPGSPLMETLRMPIRMIYEGITKRSIVEAAKVPAIDVYGALNPMWHLITEQITGRDMTGKPVPSLHQLVAREKSTQPSVSLAEYGAEKITPIGASAALTQFFQELRDGNWDPKTAKDYVTELAKPTSTGVAAALAGTHIHFDTEYQEKQAAAEARGHRARKGRSTYRNATFRLLP